MLSDPKQGNELLTTVHKVVKEQVEKMFAEEINIQVEKFRQHLLERSVGIISDISVKIAQDINVFAENITIKIPIKQ